MVECTLDKRKVSSSSLLRLIKVEIILNIINYKTLFSKINYFI
jgi:hypothetical protein